MKSSTCPLRFQWAMAVPQTKSIVSVSRLDTCFDVAKNSLLFKELAPQWLFSLIVPSHMVRGCGPLTLW